MSSLPEVEIASIVNEYKRLLRICAYLYTMLNSTDNEYSLGLSPADRTCLRDLSDTAGKLLEEFTNLAPAKALAIALALCSQPEMPDYCGIEITEDMESKYCIECQCRHYYTERLSILDAILYYTDDVKVVELVTYIKSVVEAT